MITAEAPPSPTAPNPRPSFLSVPSSNDDMPTLPAETLLQIFEAVADLSPSGVPKSTLSACCLVTKSFLEPARDVLYTTLSAAYSREDHLSPSFPIVDLALGREDLRCGVATRSLSAAISYPHLAARVRTLSLVDQVGLYIMEVDAAQTQMLEDAYSETISAMLAQFDGLTSLELTVNSVWAVKAVTRALEGYGQRFVRLYYTPGDYYEDDDETGELQDMVSLLPTLLRQLPNVRHLDVGKLSFLDQTGERSSPLPLESLRLSGRAYSVTFAQFTFAAHATLRTLLLATREPLDLSPFVNLHHLAVRGPRLSGPEEGLHDTLSTAPASLRSLELRKAYLLGPITVSCPSTITTLTLQLCDLSLPTDPLPSTTPFFDQLCADLAQPGQLQRLDFSSVPPHYLSGPAHKLGYSAAMRDRLAQACADGGVLCERALPVSEQEV